MSKIKIIAVKSNIIQGNEYDTSNYFVSIKNKQIQILDAKTSNVVACYNLKYYYVTN